MSGSFFLVSIWTSKKWAGDRALVREMIWTGLPVVSCPDMPAAEMAIRGEELRDGDLPLAHSPLDGGDRRSGGRGGSGRTGLRMSLLAATRCQWLARWFA